VKQPCVYILSSREYGTLYVGVTSDLIARLWQHRSGDVKGFTSRYRVHRLVRFEQFAPEDPKMDFAGQTAFVATLDREAEQVGRDTVKLFHAARRTGRKTVVVHGRFYVDVTFGDFPYAMRFSPAR